MSGSPIQSVSPFNGLHFATAGGGVRAVDRPELAVVRIIARRGHTDALSQRLRERIGVELPRGPMRSEGEDVAFIGLGVDTWLATTEGHHNEFAASLKEVVGELGSVSDQTGAYGVLRLTGNGVAGALARLIGLDLHPREFRPGSAASTAASHIAVTIWRLADGPDGLARFEIAVPRSFAVSFWEALTASAAQFGFEFSPPPEAAGSPHSSSAR